MIKRFCALILCVMLSGCACHKETKEVVRFSTWGSASEMTILTPIIKEFEDKNSDIKIEVMHIPQDYFQKVHLLFASNLEPDVIFINNLNLPVYSSRLEKLNDICDKSLFEQKALQALSVGEDVYALPRDVSNLVIYYNKSLFRKYGVPYPSCDWTLDDLLKVSKRLTHRGVWAISYEPAIDYSLPYMYYMGGGILSENMDLIVNSDNSMSGIKFYKDLAYKYHYAPLPFQTGSKTLAQMFLEGRICMHLSGRWLVPKYRECAKFEWDIVNFPKYTSCCDASGWAVSKSSRHKNSAKKFVLFLSSKENISKMTKSGLITPARLDVSHSDVFLSGKPKSSQLFLESIKYSKNRPVSKNYNKLIDQLNDELFAGDD